MFTGDGFSLNSGFTEILCTPENPLILQMLMVMIQRPMVLLQRLMVMLQMHKYLLTQVTLQETECLHDLVT